MDVKQLKEGYLQVQRRAMGPNEPRFPMEQKGGEGTFQPPGPPVAKLVDVLGNVIVSDPTKVRAVLELSVEENVRELSKDLKLPEPPKLDRVDAMRRGLMAMSAEEYEHFLTLSPEARAEYSRQKMKAQQVMLEQIDGAPKKRAPTKRPKGSQLKALQYGTKAELKAKRKRGRR